MVIIDKRYSELEHLLDKINNNNNDSASSNHDESQELMKLISSEKSELANQLLSSLNHNNNNYNASKAASSVKERFEILPESGFVLKTSNKKKVGEWPEGIKVFINFCHSPHIPAPPPGTDEEILNTIHAEDLESYKVPTSLSNPRRDTDRVGRECCVFDVCVHTNALQMASRLEDYQLFLMEMILQYIEEKSKLQLSRDISFPKMKSKGQLVKHIIYRPKRPMVIENTPVLSNQKKMKSSLPSSSSKKNIIMLSAPKYEIISSPSDAIPKSLLVRIHLPNIESTKDTELDLESDKLFLHVPNAHELRVALPWPVLIDHCKAQFDRSNRYLNVYLVCA